MSKNKGGRPKLSEAEKSLEKRLEFYCKRMANAKGIELLEKILDENKTPNLDVRIRLEALKIILERGYGKAKARNESDVTVTNINFTEAWQNALKQASKPTSAPKGQDATECDSLPSVH